jgi:predicted ester cyclase
MSTIGRSTRRSHLAAVLIGALLVLGVLAPRSVAGGAGTPQFALTNEEVVHLLFGEVLTLADADLSARIVDEQARLHTPNGDYRGAAGVSTFAASWQALLATVRFEVSDLISDGDAVTARWTMHGSAQGAADVAISIEGIAVIQLRDLRIVEGWMQYDRMGLAQQLAAVSPDGAMGGAAAPVAGVIAAPGIPTAVPRPDLCAECLLPS